MEDRDHAKEEVEQSFALKRLQERVWRLEAENKELRNHNSILQTQYTSQCETQSDMLRTLYGDLEENYSKVEEAEAKIKRLEEQLEDQKQKAYETLEAEKAKWENTTVELEQKVETLETKLHELREFQKNKDAMEAELASLKQQLQDQAEEHVRKTSEADRNKVMEIDQMTKDMQRQIKETREMLKAKTRDQLDSTTKRTIMENEQYATELQFHSKETERLLAGNQKLLQENAQLRRNLQIHKDLENELARRTHLYQKLLKSLSKEQKAELSRSEHSRDDSTAGAPSSAAAGASRELSLEVSASGEEADRLRRQLEGAQGTLQLVRHEFAQYRRDHATLTQLQDQSTRLIISALYELKNQRACDPFPPATYDEEADWAFATMTGRQKEYFFRVLLEKLNSSMCSSCFPTGPQPAGQSVPSLPQIGRGPQQAQDQGPHKFSQFLWSVATHGGYGSSHNGSSQKELSHKSAQTETVASDPCFKEGLWSPQSRPRHSQSSSVTPAMVSASVRSWGQRAGSHHRARGMGRVV